MKCLMEKNDAEENICYEADKLSAAIFLGGDPAIGTRKKDGTEMFNTVGKVSNSVHYRQSM